MTFMTTDYARYVRLKLHLHLNWRIDYLSVAHRMCRFHRIEQVSFRA